MRRALVLVLVMGLVVGGITTAEAAKKKKKKSVETTLYLHGNTPVGEGELVTFVESGATRAGFMDSTPPVAGAPKSQFFGHPGGNEECMGNPFYPSWGGLLTGTIVGDLEVTLHFLSPASSAQARLWDDVTMFACTSSNTGSTDFRPPSAEAVVDIPAGANEVTFTLENVKLAVAANLVFEVHTTSPSPGRIMYDSPEFEAKLVFKCIPASGTKCA